MLGGVGENEPLTWARDRYIEEPSFFLKSLVIVPAANRGKLSVEDPDDKDDIPF